MLPMRSGSNRRIATRPICEVLVDANENSENFGTNGTVSRKSQLRALDLLYG